jgi:hypothetical protein
MSHDTVFGIASKDHNGWSKNFQDGRRGWLERGKISCSLVLGSLEELSYLIAHHYQPHYWCRYGTKVTTIEDSYEQAMELRRNFMNSRENTVSLTATRGTYSCNLGSSPSE